MLTPATLGLKWGIADMPRLNEAQILQVNEISLTNLSVKITD
jgi:hypothetical protein